MEEEKPSLVKYLLDYFKNEIEIVHLKKKRAYFLQDNVTYYKSKKAIESFKHLSMNYFHNDPIRWIVLRELLSVLKTQVNAH